MLGQIKENWRTAFESKEFRQKFFVIVPMFIIILLIAANYLAFNEERRGYPICDPVLSLFKEIDVTWFTFVLIYGGLLLALVHLLHHPRSLLLAFICYTICISARMICMYLLPLEAPAGIIPLIDPTIYFFGSGRTYLKDLFFSGHVSTIFILYLTAQNKWIRQFFLWGTVLIGIAVLAQHVHYSIDVFAAPFFAFASYNAALLLMHRK